MRIKELAITRYGPLANTGRIKLKGFNLFFGRNEDGKTLTIDAIVKLLFTGKTRVFENISRVDESPEGYVILTDQNGQEIKLPEKGTITELVNLTPTECRNIFIIRNSDLTVSSESEFYTQVTDRLSGLRTAQISAVKDNLLEIGKLTPTGVFRDIRGEKLKTRIENATSLIQKTNDLVAGMEDKKFDQLEEENAKYKEDLEGIEQRLSDFEHARKREKYEKGKDAIGKLQQYLEEYMQLQTYQEEERQLWWSCERDLNTYSQEKEQLVQQIRESESKLEDTAGELSNEQGDFEVAEQTKKKLDYEIRPQIENYQNKHLQITQKKRKRLFLVWAGLMSGILLGISLIGIIVRPSVLFYILVCVFGITTGVSARLIFQLLQSQALLGETFEKISLELARFGLNAQSIENILSNLEEFDNNFSKKGETLRELQVKKQNLGGKIKELRDETIPNVDSKIQQGQEKIEEVKIKSKEESLDDYTRKLARKQEVDGLVKQQESVLTSHFGTKGDELKDNIAFWEQEISKLEEYKDKAKDKEYDENEVAELKNEAANIESRQQDIETNMRTFRDNMKEIERKANQILQLEDDYLNCETSLDLQILKDSLQKFIDTSETNRENALSALEIFELIETEEKERISQLFGKESAVSRYMAEITDGLYEQVIFNTETGKIEVERKDGVLLPAEKLSSGAYDQLYFSIRLALGERLLKDKRGFFIMDDPFVKADLDRLLRQIEVLRKIAGLGWQIMYFSAKGEIQDALREDINRGAVNYMEVQTTF